jgi:hypothetical protein
MKISIDLILKENERWLVLKKISSITNKKTLLFLVLLALILVPRGVMGQLRFRLRPYVGIGLGIDRQSEPPLFEILNESDQDYYDQNLASLRSTHLRFQTRVNVLEWGHLSMGYLFWNHSFEYPDKLPGGIVITNRAFPHSYLFSVHGGSLQWNFYRKPSSRLVPFVMAGAGGYYGSFKNYYRAVEDEEDGTSERIVSKIITYQGPAAFIGVGMVVFEYGYIYVGYLDLIKKSLPSRQFIDVIVGVTF